MSRLNMQSPVIKYTRFRGLVLNTLGRIQVRNATSVHPPAANQTDSNYDIVVVGGGIVGMATARELLIQKPSLKLAVLEKEKCLAYHQTGHNSGVIHAGIYYKPGSLKAQLCVKGLDLTYKFCDKKNIPYKKVGKLIVATNKVENERLDDLIERGCKNNVPDLKVLERKKIKEIEPYCQGLRALWSPHTGIVDWAQVTEHFGKDVNASGGNIFLNFKVKGFSRNITGKSEAERKKYPLCIFGDKMKVNTSYAVVCGGLYSDKLAELSGCTSEPRIVPIRGDYMILSREKSKLIKGNIYPVPDPKYPFLGVHFTPRMDGSVWLGPSAVLAFQREGYKWNDINLKDLREIFTYSGFMKLALSNVRFGLDEVMKAIFLSRQVSEIQKFVPEITVHDVKRGPSGVRAQALDKNGNLVEDFVFDLNKSNEIGKRVLHCRNAPSPGATSSLAIASMIVEKVFKEFSIK